MASSSLVPRIIVLALGAGALGFPDALLVLLDIAGQSPLTDMAICVLAMAVVTAQVLGAMLLARFVRKAARAGGVTHAHGLAPMTPPRTDRFAVLTLVVSLAVAFLVSACLLVAPGAGAGGLGLFHLAADVTRKSPVSAVVAIGTAVLPCARPLLRVFRREEDHSHGPTTAAAGSSSAWMGRFVNVAQVASFTGAAAFVLVASGGFYIQRGSLVDVSVGGVAAVVGTVLLAGFTFTRRARNADTGAGGRAAPPPTADTRGFDGKLARLALYLVVVSFAVSCLVLSSLTAPRTHDSA